MYLLKMKKKYPIELINQNMSNALVAIKKVTCTFLKKKSLFVGKTFCVGSMKQLESLI